MSNDERLSRRVWATLGLFVACAVLTMAPEMEAQQPKPAIVLSEFIFEDAPFASAHASTIVETHNGLVAAWFGGTEEGDPDVGIWLSRHNGSRWAEPVEIANGIQPDGTRHPCWNPVLFRPANGPLLLFYKVGPNPRTWWGLVRTSTDQGRTWSAAARLPDGILGPIRAKPVELTSGTLLAGSSFEHTGWVSHIERAQPTTGGAWSIDSLASPSVWRRSAALNNPNRFAAIQPTILVHSPTRLQALCRSRQEVITESWSNDGGKTWSPMVATTLPNPNAGIDTLRLTDGRFLLIYNPRTRGREQLAIAISADGQLWRRIMMLENAQGEYSYPAMIQTGDGLIHVTYTWKRQRIKHVVIDSAQLDAR